MQEQTKSEVQVKNKPGEIRRDGFPELVGLRCYICHIRERFGDDDPNACGPGNDNLGRNITCTHGYDKNNDLVPVRGCLKGKTSKVY